MQMATRKSPWLKEREKEKTAHEAEIEATWKKLWADPKYVRCHERMEKANHHAYSISSYPKLYTAEQIEAAERAFKRAHNVMQDYEDEFFKKEGVRKW